MSDKLNKLSRDKYGVFLLSLLLFLFLVRLTLPQLFKFILFPGIGLFLGLSTIRFLNRPKNYFSKDILIFLPFGLITIIYFIAFFTTPDKQDIFLKDGFNGLITVLFIIGIYFMDFSPKSFHDALNKFQIFVVVSVGIIAFLGIIKLILQFYGVYLDFLKVEVLGYPTGASLAIDDSFFSLACLLAIIFTVLYLFKRLKFIISLLVQFSLFILLFNILLSTSRRGLLVAVVFISILILIVVLSFIYRSDRLRNFRKNSIVVGLLTISALSSYYFFAFKLTALARNRWLVNSSLNHYEVNNYLNWLTLAGRTVVQGQTTYNETRKELWETTFDPNYPYTGWVNGNYKLITKLEGENVSIVPNRAQGAMIDNSEKGSTWEGNAYYYSPLFEKNVEKDIRYIASVYCYVSSDFNGEWVRINSNGNINGFLTSYYDLNKKGSWQQLRCSFEGVTGSFRTVFYLKKSSSSSLDSLTGHVIFAYPELKETSFDPKNPITWTEVQYQEIEKLPGKNFEIVPKNSVGLKLYRLSYSRRDSLNYSISNLPFKPKFKNEERNVVSIYAYVSEDFNGDEVCLRATGKNFGYRLSKYDIKNKGVWQKLMISTTPNDINVKFRIESRKILESENDSIKGDVIFCFPEINFIKFDPKNPLSWSSSKIKPVYKIENQMLPLNTIGLLLDKESDFRKHPKTSVYYLNSPIKRDTIYNNQRYLSTIYCYVTNDFNGENVRITSSGDKLNGGRVYYYDLNRKGEWQKLILINYSSKSSIQSNIYFSIPKGINVESLKGKVIFAYPEFRKIEYSSNNPESFIANNYLVDKELNGTNNSILPAGIIGFKFDKKTVGSQWRHIHHFTNIYNSIHVGSGDSLIASVFCYVSDDFNGNDVRIEIRGKKSISSIKRYNLKEKGKWVKLETKVNAKEEGLVNGILYFSQKTVSDFSKLKGSVTFAYPELKVIKSPKTSQLVIPEKRKTYKIEKATILPLSVIFNSSSTQQDSSVLDTLNNSLPFQKEMSNDHFSGPRLDRWRYALYLYKNEYKWWQKIIGGGVGFTRKFAKEFSDPDEYDYPHNPFLSVLLYSGIIGLLAYLWFLYKAVFYYWIYRKEYWTFGLAFGAAFFFAFFSAGNPFEPQILGVLSILPYFIHYYNYKGKDKI